MAIHIEIIDIEFQPFQRLAKHQTICTSVGAQSVFIGYMRDFRENNPVEQMVITHYPEMTKCYIEKLAEQLIKDFQLLDLYVVHRIGKVFPTSPLVVVSATASHRTNAIQATTRMLEQLKQTAPFWKKEYYTADDKGQWIASNTANNLHKMQ
ncbi:MAG: molybdenum cofactor biosynthesis protein MoaE [Ostreibacterium sp.]